MSTALAAGDNLLHYRLVEQRFRTVFNNRLPFPPQKFRNVFSDSGQNFFLLELLHQWIYKTPYWPRSMMGKCSRRRPRLSRSSSGWKRFQKSSHGGGWVYNRGQPGSQNGNPGLVMRLYSVPVLMLAAAPLCAQ